MGCGQSKTIEDPPSFNQGDKGTAASVKADASLDAVKLEERPPQARGEVLKPQARRVGVSAAVTKAEPYKKKDVPKSQAVRELISASINGNLLFEGVTAEGKEAIIDAMDSEERMPGEAVITEGDVGDYFYVVESGEYEVFLNAKGASPVHKYATIPGEVAPYFGDLALLYSCPRKATVKCSTSGVVWRLAATDYKQVLMNVNSSATASRVQFLKSVDILTQLKAEQLDALASTIEEVPFTNGQLVVKQGDPADALYFIQKGTVEVYVGAGEEAQLVATMEAGQSIGENAVSGEARPVRAATIKAKGAVQMLKLHSNDFRELIGGLADAVAANFSQKVLGGMEMFNALNGSEKQVLVDSLVERKYSSGTTIIKKGDEGSTFYIILKGSVKVTSGLEVIKENLGTGEYFGEVALLRSEPRMATITATSDTVCMELGRDKFNEILGSIDDIINREATKREREAQAAARPSVEYKDLEQRSILGVGTFGRVRLVKHRPTGAVYALKAMRKGQIVALKQTEHVMSEKNILAMLKHPFVLTLVAAYQDADELYMLLEIALGGELFSLLRDRIKFDEPTSRFYSANVCAVFEYMHDRRIVYRDLKPENLLLDSSGYLKVVDFGFAKVLDDRTWTLCGTPEYLAPEIISNKGHNLAVDWWALGILIFELLNGLPPFAADDPMEIYQKILRGKVVYPMNFSKMSRDIISKLLVPNPAARLGMLKRGFREVREQPFFKAVNFGELEKRSVKAPVIPKIKSAMDTSNFEYYEDTDGQEWARFNDKNNDPFGHFSPWL